MVFYQYLSQSLYTPKKSHAYSVDPTNTVRPTLLKFCDRFRFAARTTGTLDPANSAQRGLCACVYIAALYIEYRSGA